MSLKERALAYKNRILPENASRGRRAIVFGVPTVAAGIAGVAVADKLGAFDRPQAQPRELPVRPDANPAVEVGFVNDTLQNFVTPRLNGLLRNLGQLPFESNGFVRFPESGITIGRTDDGQQININRTGTDPISGRELNHHISFIYQKDRRDAVWAVSVSTTQDGNPSSMTDMTLGIDPVAGKSGYLTLSGAAPTHNHLTTSPTATMPYALHRQPVEAFKQRIVDALNFIDPRENETSDAIDAKMAEWQTVLLGLESNDKRQVVKSEHVTNERPQIQITAQADADTSYHITYTLEGEKIRGLVVSKNEKGTPFIENEYEMYRDRNEVDWDMLRTRIEDGKKARGTGQQGGSTRASSVKRLTTAQFEAWSQNIDQIIGQVAAVK